MFPKMKLKEGNDVLRISELICRWFPRFVWFSPAVLGLLVLYFSFPNKREWHFQVRGNLNGQGLQSV